MCAAVARAYVPDTEVVGVEEDEVQVLLQDDDAKLRWHRRANLEPCDHTACGRQYDWRFHQLGMRLSRLEGEMCLDGCFTPFELGQAMRLAKEARKGQEP